MSEPRDKGFETASWLFVWVVMAVLGAYGIRACLQRELNQLHAQLDANVESAMRAGQEELSVFGQDLKVKAREAEAHRRVELEKLWGGPMGAAFKNPALSIRDALNQAAKACAPSNTLAFAEVDRFTEFTVTVDSGDTISTNAMVAFARSFLPLAKTYLDSIRFSQKGTLIAEIDRQDIEFIEDWSRAPDQRIAMLLPRESRSRITEDPALIERYKNEQRIAEAIADDSSLREKAQRADRNLRRTVEKAYEELNSALESVRISAALGTIHSLRDLDKLDKALKTAVQHSSKSEEFWKDPAKEWESILDSEGISGELRAALVKDFPSIYRQNPKKTASVFSALNTEIKSTRYAMRILTSEGDNWRFSNGQILLIDPDFAKRFENANRQIREDAQQTDAVLRAWREAIGP
jgi:hypothetical protein